MSDTQAAMREFRFLDDKRKTNGLTPNEEQRWYELAAQLGVDMSQYGQWGADGQWYPYPPGYDPNQQQWGQQQQQPGYYDNQAPQQGWYGQQQQQPGYYAPNQQQAYDNQPAYDPNQPAYDPNQPAYDPNQAAYDPNQAAYDPNQPAYDPNQPAYDPNQPAYDPNQPAYDPNQQQGYGYAQQQYAPQGWYGHQQQQPGYYPPNPQGYSSPPLAYGAPEQQQGSWEQPAPPQGPAPTWQPDPAAAIPSASPSGVSEVAGEEVMEVSDEEVSPIPTAPPAQARQSSAVPPLNLNIPEDPVADLRSALLDDEEGGPTAPPRVSAPPVVLPHLEPPPIKIPSMPLFGGAGFSKASAPEAPRKVEATAVSSLLPAPADELPLVSLNDSESAATQLEVAAVNALSELPSVDDVPESSISGITEVADVELGGADAQSSPLLAELSATPESTDVLPDLPMLGSKTLPTFDSASSDGPVIDPTPSMMVDVASDGPIIDPTPSMMFEPAHEAGALLDVPPLAEAPATVSLLDVPMLEEPIAGVAAATKGEALPAVEVAPVAEATRVVETAPIFESAPVVDAAPVFESAPVVEVDSVFESAPVVGAATVFESAPVVEAATVFESAPVVEAASVFKSAPVADAPIVGTSAFDDAPIVEAASSLDTEPIAETSPVVEAAAAFDADPIVEAFEATSATDVAPLVDSAPVTGESFDVSMSSDDVPVDSNWAEVVQASRAPQEAFAPSLDELPVLDSVESQPTGNSFESLDDLPVVGGEVLTGLSSAPSAFDALAIPPPLASSPGAAIRTDVAAARWEAPAAPVAPWQPPVPAAVSTDWAAAPSTAPPAATEVFASSWDDPIPLETEPAAAASQVFASHWEDDAAAAPLADRSVFGDVSTSAPELAGQPEDQVELASNADFIPGGLTNELPTMDVGDVSVDSEPFEVESGPAASLANPMSMSSESSIEEAQIELSSNADFLDAKALTSTGESWQRSGAAIDVEEELDGEIIQGVVVEEDLPGEPAGWDAEIPVAPPLNTRVAVPAPTFAPPAPPAPARVPAPVVAAPAPSVMPVQPPPRVMADELFDRSGAVKSSGPVQIAGEHRVILHTMEGQVKRGALKDPDLGADSLSLEGPSGVEGIALGRVKAIFFMLAPGARSPASTGQKVRVTFKDGRQVAGFSRDHGQAGPGFFVVPADNRTNTERIYIYRHGVQTVSIES